MSLHIPYTHQCPKCSAFYIPYAEDVCCPSCGVQEDKSEVFDTFIQQAANSAEFNFNSHGSYIPPAWWVGTFGDHILSLLFGILEQHRTTENSESFADVARRMVDKIEWSDQEYTREHLYQIALKVQEQIEQNTEDEQ